MQDFFVFISVKLQLVKQKHKMKKAIIQSFMLTQF